MFKQVFLGTTKFGGHKIIYARPTRGYGPAQR